MNKYPEKDWRAMIREIIVAPTEKRTGILKAALSNMANEEDRVMALIDLQRIFGSEKGEDVS